jgi:hypothetical protein
MVDLMSRNKPVPMRTPRNKSCETSAIRYRHIIGREITVINLVSVAERNYYELLNQYIQNKVTRRLLDTEVFYGSLTRASDEELAAASDDMRQVVTMMRYSSRAEGLAKVLRLATANDAFMVGENWHRPDLSDLDIAQFHGAVNTAQIMTKARSDIEALVGMPKLSQRVFRWLLLKFMTNLKLGKAMAGNSDSSHDFDAKVMVQERGEMMAKALLGSTADAALGVIGSAVLPVVHDKLTEAGFKIEAVEWFTAIRR